MKNGTQRLWAVALAIIFALTTFPAAALADVGVQALLLPEDAGTLALGESGTYTLTVSATDGGGIDTGASGSYKEGDEVELKAKSSGSHTFLGWISTGGGSFSSPDSLSTTFTMPGADTTVLACYVVKIKSTEWQVIAQTNKQAIKNGNNPMATTTNLQRAMSIRADELTELFSHTRPDGSSCFTVFPEAGVSVSASGENIAAGYATPSAAVSGWMNSSGHKANILRGSSHMGAGHQTSTKAQYSNYWVQLFGNARDDIAIAAVPAVSARTGTSIDNLGAFLILEYDGNTETSYIPVISEMCSGYSSSKTGTQQVTVSYRGMDVVMEVTLGSGSGSGSGSGGSGSGGGSSGGGRSSGGGGGGGSRTDSAGSSGSTAAVNAAAGRSANVGADGAVSASVRSEWEKAAASAAPGSTVTVTTRNALTISPANLQALAAAAAAAGKTAVIHADTTTANGQSVQGRLYVEPAKLTALTTDLKLAVYTESGKTSALKGFFEKYYSNTVEVVRLEQQGSLGARLQVAAKANLAGLNTSGLVFYSYDRTTNQYARMANPNYWVDSAGYLHFYTQQGGDILVTDKVLTRR